MKLILLFLLFGLLSSAVQAQNAFIDYGVGAKVAENRGVVATVTKDGRPLVICHALDVGTRGFIVVTDIDSGETKQFYCPEGVPQSAPFGALMSASGRFYTTQGKCLLEFDPSAGKWTFRGTPPSGVSSYLCFTQGPDGVVWAGGAYKTAPISFDPETREAKAHPVLDEGEQYLNTLAVDKSGWVYAGIGTARCNLVAYNPKTGEKHQLIDEGARVHGTGTVYPTTDGAVYGEAAGQSYRLLDGEATPIDKSAAAPRKQVGDIHYGGRLTQFPDGRRVSYYDLPGRLMKVEDADGKLLKSIAFDYETEGADLTSLAEGPNGVVYASSCHPMHLIALDTKAKEMTDLGYISKIGGGNFCAMARNGNLLIGAEYAGGRLWAYDVTKPWNPDGKREILGIAPRELVESGECTEGHFTYLESHDVAFFHGDKVGAEGTVKLDAPADGKYYLHLLPYRSERYGTVQFLFDGKPIGQPYVATGKSTEVGELLVHGPFDLKAGEHRLTLKMLESEGQEPWCALVTADLSTRKREVLMEQTVNPSVLAQWKKDICRPRTALAHPDGKHVMMAGFAGYGLCGGGIGLYNLETKEETLLTADKDLLPGHSCITLKALPNGDLVGGTSISAPGGGHPTAKEGELFLLDWKTKRLTHHLVPVPGDGHLNSLQVPEDGLVYGLSSNSTFFVFDPASKTVVHSESYREYGGVPRHALQLGPDGKLYAMLSKAILRITPGTFEHEKLADSPVNISAGGALTSGLLCFASRSHVWTYAVPGL